MLSRRISPIRLPFISDANKSPTAKAAAKTTRPIRRLVRPTRNNSRRRCRKHARAGGRTRELRRAEWRPHPADLQGGPDRPQALAACQRHVLCPTDNEFLGFRVPVFIAEWRGVN
jgi:hypothetical protein